MVANKITPKSRSTRREIKDVTVEGDVQAMKETIRKQQLEIEELNQRFEKKITERTRALEEAQALTHLGSWEWDIGSNIISWSDELYRIYGLKPQEIAIGYEEFLGMIHPEDRRRVEAVIGEAFQTAQPFEFEHRIMLPTGTERILKGVGRIVTDDDGKPVRMHGTSQDITLAKQLDRAKDEFISLVSHQLRTPLTIIRIHGSMLEDGIAGPLTMQQQAHVQTMTDASVRLIKLVGDILNVSRATLNRVKVNTVPADPNALIRACIDEVLPLARAKDVTITFAPDASLGLLLLDVTIFGEILRNLTANAVRYAKDAGGQIDITFEKEKHGYLLTVADSGIGIPEVDQAYVFERFYRANNATVIDSGGSGLGLYIVKLFTEAAGGKIWFESTEGRGTTFYVSFPFMRAP